MIMALALGASSVGGTVNVLITLTTTDVNQATKIWSYEEGAMKKTIEIIELVLIENKINTWRLYQTTP